MRVLLVILILIVTCTAAQAGIQWTWTNAGTGTEQGTFITSGVLVDDQAPAGNYTIYDYSITASAWGLEIGSVSGGEYYISQPDIGFVWDGAAPTTFWRSSGVYLNGFWLWATTYTPGQPDMLGMNVEWLAVVEDDEVDHYGEDLTPVFTPTGTATPNERATFGAVKALFR